MIWPHSREELNSFTQTINTCHKSIKFTIDIEAEKANFLDVTIFKDSTGTPQYTLNQQISMRTYTYTIHLQNNCLQNDLSAQGQPRGLIKKAIEKASKLDRLDLLDKTRNTIITKRTVPFIFTYKPYSPLPPINKILCSFKTILHETTKFINFTKILAVPRRAKTRRTYWSDLIYLHSPLLTQLHSLPFYVK